MAQIPLADLLDIIKIKAGDDVTQELLDTLLAECFAWMHAGPAACKRDDWLVWDDVPGAVQGILIGVLARHASGGGSNVVAERIGDYSVRYADSSLFEGRQPTFFLDAEEVAIAKVAGCGGALGSLSLGGVPLIGVSGLHGLLVDHHRKPREQAGGGN